MPTEDMIVFGGSGSIRLTQNICQELNIQSGSNETIRFSEGNLFVRILENVRGRHIYLVQSTGYPANDNFMELLFWIDAFRRASAASITVIMPYFSYAKGDKKDEPRVSIRARVCADAIEAAGANRIVTMDLHAAQIQGFFKIPVDDLYALPVLCNAVQSLGLSDGVVISPDAGFAKQARKYASYLKTDLAIGDKERSGHDQTAAVLNLMGNVKNKTTLIVDDVTISGGTLVEMSHMLVDKGATSVNVLVTHGALSQEGVDQINTSPIEQVFMTDTIETQPCQFSSKFRTVSIAPLFAEAIRRIHNNESISVLFPA